MFLNVERAGDEHTDRYGSGSGNGCMEAWMHGLVNRCMHCLVDGCLDVSLAVRMHGRLNGTNIHTNEKHKPMAMKQQKETKKTNMNG